MLTECLTLIKYEGADCVEVHTGEPPVVFIHRPGARTLEYCPTSPQRLAVVNEAVRKASQPNGAFAGPGVYHVTQNGTLTFIP